MKINRIDHLLRAGSLFFASKRGKFTYEDFSSCPLCESNAFLSYQKSSHLGLSVNLKKCKTCELIFQSPKMTESSLELFYKKYYRSHFMSERQKQKHCEVLFKRGQRRGEGFLKFVEKFKFKLSNLPIVEIGASYGGTLHFLKQKGYDVIGCDMDPFAISYGQKLGLNLKLGGLEELEDVRAGLIILSHVLEHILNPLSFLAQLKGILEKEGLVLVQVPYFKPGERRSIQVGHILYFTPETLLFLFDKSEYKRVALEVGKSTITALFRI